jgi:hypothetical protein
MLGYTVSLILAYLVFSAVIRWELFGSRYQLPFFVLSGALSGVILSSLLSRKGILILELLLLTTSLPWLFFNRTRPLIGIPPRITAVGSIFSTNRTDLLLANQEWIREPIIKLTNSFQSINCQKVGLWIDSRDPEYIFWSLLNAQTRGIRIESLFYEPHLEIYADKTFTPCAIICSICGGKANLDGLSLAYREHGIDLYLSTDYKSP